MPPQVTYWTGIWQPGREGLSNEVQALRHAGGAPSPVVSFSVGQRSGISFGDRVVRLSSRRWLTLRMLAAAMELRGDVTHVFGGLDEWHLLRAVGRRPVLFTAALPGRLDAALGRKVSFFAAETEQLAAALVDGGVPSRKVDVVYPGVDLCEFSPGTAPPAGPFRILFASSPADPREFERRGIPFLVELGRRRPDVQIVLLWRRWGQWPSIRRALAALSLPENVVIETRGDRSMPDIYRSAHATICCYEAGFGKSCPNSIVESLACGRPVLVSDTCGLAGLIRRARAGVAFARVVDAVEPALEEVRSNYQHYAANARALAVSRFDLDLFRSRYRDLYVQLGDPFRSSSGALVQGNGAAS